MLSKDLADQPQHPHRVVVGGLPEVAIQTPEQLDGIVIPRPAQIVRQSSQPFEPGGQGGDHFKYMRGLHAISIEASKLK